MANQHHIKTTFLFPQKLQVALFIKVAIENKNLQADYPKGQTKHLTTNGVVHLQFKNNVHFHFYDGENYAY